MDRVLGWIRSYWIILIFGLPFLICGVLFLLAWRRQVLDASSIISGDCLDIPL
jgi:hypothetical protein